MKKDEALKLALEFIERVNRDGWILADFEPQMYATITAIKEALAQSEEPKPQRTWVGLTDEDKKQIAKEANYHWEMTAGEYAERIGQLTEAKLKEKNT